MAELSIPGVGPRWWPFARLRLRGQLLASVGIISLVALVAALVGVMQVERADRNLQHITELQKPAANALRLDAELQRLYALSESLVTDWDQPAAVAQKLGEMRQTQQLIRELATDLPGTADLRSQLDVFIKQAQYLNADLEKFQQSAQAAEPLIHAANQLFDEAIRTVATWAAYNRVAPILKRMHTELTAIPYIAIDFQNPIDYAQVQNLAGQFVEQNRPAAELRGYHGYFDKVVDGIIEENHHWQRVGEEIAKLKDIIQRPDDATSPLMETERQRLIAMVPGFERLYDDSRPGQAATLGSMRGFLHQKGLLSADVKVGILVERGIATKQSSIVAGEIHKTAGEIQSVTGQVSRSNRIAFWLSLAAVAVGLVGVFGIALVIDRTVLRRLGTVTRGMLRVAAGETIVIERNPARDEIGELLLALQAFQDAELQRREFRQKLQQINRSLEEAISGSISVAARIQSRLFRTHVPSHGEYLSAQALLSRPRDAIGGDCAWAEQFEDSCVIALIDCTGHGVPGAMMTIVIALLINTILRSEERRDPALILTRLAEAFKNTLVDRDFDDLDTGFDGAICVIDPARKVLNYAGGGLPLIVQWPDAVKPQLIAGDGVGPDGTLASVDAFHTRRLPLVPGLRFYLASDGLASQPDDRGRSAFGWPRLLQAVQATRTMSLAAQQDRIWQNFCQYRGTASQKDDVTILGVQI